MDCDKPITNDRQEIFLYPQINSGILEHQKFPYNADTKYPVLRMPFNIYDADGNILPHGMYQIVLDYDRNYLLFVQSNEIKARVPVASYTDYNYDKDENKEQREKLAKEYEKLMIKGKQKKAKEVKKELQIFDERVKSKMSATIDTSQKGVYILNYETAFEKAFAVIPIY